MTFRRPLEHLSKKQKNDPQHIFRRLSVLEVKKKVAFQEREDALQRLKKIDNKLKEIDNTINSLLGHLDLCPPYENLSNSENNEVQSSMPSKGRLLKAKPQSDPDKDRRFVVRY